MYSDCKADYYSVLKARPSIKKNREICPEKTTARADHIFRQPVSMTVRSHLFPFRTQKLSSLVPKIVGWTRPVKIGRCGFSQNRTPEAYALGVLLFGATTQTPPHMENARCGGCSGLPCIAFRTGKRSNAAAVPLRRSDGLADKTKPSQELSNLRGFFGGKMGIRTPERFYTLHDFQSCALDQLSHLSICFSFVLPLSVERSIIIHELPGFVKPFLKKVLRFVFGLLFAGSA